MSAKLNCVLILMFCCLVGQIFALNPTLLSSLAQGGSELTPEGTTLDSKIPSESNVAAAVVELKVPESNPHPGISQDLLGTLAG